MDNEREKLAVIREVVSTYHTTRLSGVSAETHILSKGPVQAAFERLAARTYPQGRVACMPTPAKPEDAEVRGMKERLRAKWPADFELRFGYINPDGPAAATLITRLAGSVSGEWLPQIGERVEVVEDYPDSGSWLRTPLWVAGIRVAESGDGLDITVTEQWPVPYRHASNYLGHTDGFFVGRRNKRNDLRPATAHMKDEA